LATFHLASVYQRVLPVLFGCSGDGHRYCNVVSAKRGAPTDMTDFLSLELVVLVGVVLLALVVIARSGKAP
jgi:hypothetical protein